RSAEATPRTVPTVPVTPRREAAPRPPHEELRMMMNLAVVAGTLSSDPEIRTLPSGDRLATLQVTVRPDDAPATSVPVALTAAPAWVDDAAAGDAIVVAGPVRRRFFRAG